MAISAKLVADLLETAGSGRVLSLDLHAPQIQGYFNIPVDHLYAAPVLVEYFQKKKLGPVTVVSPDAGGVERARLFAKIVLQPGWRWSKDVKPIAKTEWCEAPHFQYAISGRLHFVTSDKHEFDFKAGDVLCVGGGHDAWVVGNEPFVAMTGREWRSTRRSGRVREIRPACRGGVQRTWAAGRGVALVFLTPIIRYAKLCPCPRRERSSQARAAMGPGF